MNGPTEQAAALPMLPRPASQSVGKRIASRKVAALACRCQVWPTGPPAVAATVDPSGKARCQEIGQPKFPEATAESSHHNSWRPRPLCAVYLGGYRARTHRKSARNKPSADEVMVTLRSARLQGNAGGVAQTSCGPDRTVSSRTGEHEERAPKRNPEAAKPARNEHPIRKSSVCLKEKESDKQRGQDTLILTTCDGGET